MRLCWAVFLACISAALAQDAAGRRGAAEPVNAAFVRENYSKFEYRIAMRDGVKLFTSVYIPKDVFSDGKTYPIMLQRTPYNVRPYGPDQYRANLGPSEFFAREKFIFVYQDIRGRFMSEGVYSLLRPHNPDKRGPQDVDESSDTYDTVDWLVKNLPGNNGKVGMYGISQPGFYVTAGMIDAHPALVAVAPQAPVTDYYMGDDVYHNGAFMLAHRFGFYQGFKLRPGGPEPPPATAQRFDYGTPDGYDFFLSMGPLANADEKYFKHLHALWELNIDHTTYDDVWQSRAIWRHLKGIKPAVMLVGGWYDTEDPQGLLKQFDFMEENQPPKDLMLVMGPWNHGGFSRGDGDRLGNINFGSKTGLYYRQNIEFPFFMYHLKRKGDGKFPKAYLFQTGVNDWRKFDSWPPRGAGSLTLYLDDPGKLSSQPPSKSGFDEYLSDPAKPVPYIGFIHDGVLNSYMTEDQRFAAERPDVLVFQTDRLAHDVTGLGPISVNLKVSTSGTDSDFVVKVIDVFPGDYPDYNAPQAPAAQPGAAPNPAAQGPANAVKMGGYEELIRGEPFRGKFRKSFEKPAPFEPGKPDMITFRLPDIDHTWREGHRIMVQIQSSWFPLVDRNPQKFIDIPKALSTDFQKATERVYFGGEDGSRIEFRVEQ
ncbi:MAG TPA: CocE/NonD family hydrolase [Bryobacteraceae bacterium]|nr:CocE/NonD family hydrolase [Bryobacteraceae bacterium]